MKKISFVAYSEKAESFIPIPKPAKLFIPKWYKGFGSFYDEKNNSYTNELSFNEYFKPFATAKTCIPFLDTFTFGYIQETWCDIQITSNNDGTLDYVFSHGDEEFPIISHRDIRTIPQELVPHGYNNNCLMHWGRYWNPVLPKGYSSFITHPLNREDLPFRCVSGIIDSDNYFNQGKVGFFIRKGFSGMIPKGTPMYQIIPFKRDSWSTDNNIDQKYYRQKIEKQRNSLLSIFYGAYKKNYWNRKDFN